MHVAFAVLCQGPVDVTVTDEMGRNGLNGGAWCSRAASTSSIGAMSTIACFRNCMMCRAASSVG